MRPGATVTWTLVTRLKKLFEPRLKPWHFLMYPQGCWAKAARLGLAQQFSTPLRKSWTLPQMELAHMLPELRALSFRSSGKEK